MIKKSVCLGVVLLCLASIISCEKDFQETGVNIIGNPAFGVKDTTINITVTPKSINSVRTDNNDEELNTYLLGVYNKTGYKKITASIVSQVTLVPDLKTHEKDGKKYTLEKVFIKLPYPATKETKNDKTNFKLNGILGNTLTSLKVYENLTYLYKLNPDNTSKKKIYYSNQVYNKNLDVLNEKSDFTFIPNALKDVEYKFTTSLAKDNEETVVTHTNNAPFLVIPLNKNKMKELLWDKFENPEFSSNEKFQKNFKGLILEASGENGSLVPFNFSSPNTPTLEFYYTLSVTEGNKTTHSVKNYSLPLSGIRVSRYDVSGSNITDNNNFIIQGTAGNMAEINFLQDEQLQKLRNKNWLINEASLTFFVDKDNSDIPDRLFLYKRSNPNTQLEDLFTYGRDLFDGTLTKKDRYNFRITKHISDLLKGTEKNSPLGLRVYNSTDFTSKNIRSYNWNPKSVKLLNGNAANGERKAQLKIYYTEKK